jgi:TPR repeat protein
LAQIVHAGALATYNLGAQLANQWDPPELDQARIWWEKAADAGVTKAMYNLGALLADRWDPPQGGPGPHLVRKRPQRRATARHFSSWRHRAYCCDATH